MFCRHVVPQAIASAYSENMRQLSSSSTEQCRYVPQRFKSYFSYLSTETECGFVVVWNFASRGVIALKLKHQTFYVSGIVIREMCIVYSVRAWALFVCALWLRWLCLFYIFGIFNVVAWRMNFKEVVCVSFLQIDPWFAYAYTLLGHEFVSTEELDNAMACFRSAIRVSPRHYNAW